MATRSGPAAAVAGGAASLRAPLLRRQAPLVCGSALLRCALFAAESLRALCRGACVRCEAPMQRARCKRVCSGPKARNTADEAVQFRLIRYLPVDASWEGWNTNAFPEGDKTRGVRGIHDAQSRCRRRAAASEVVFWKASIVACILPNGCCSNASST